MVKVIETRNRYTGGWIVREAKSGNKKLSMPGKVSPQGWDHNFVTCVEVFECDGLEFK